MSEDPFMEHPTGEHLSALAAMEDAILRLRAMSEWKRWITFCAQGPGAAPDRTQFAEVRLLGDILDTGDAVDPVSVIAHAAVDQRCLVRTGPHHYSIGAATPREAAQILDAIFRHQFDIHPFPDEGDDYAVGAEW